MKNRLVRSYSAQSSASSRPAAADPVEQREADPISTTVAASRPESRRTSSIASATSQHPPVYTDTIEELNVEQAQAAIRTMRNNLNGWTDYPDEYLRRDKAETSDEPQENKWYDRIKSTEAMLDVLNTNDPGLLANYKIFAYQYQHPISREIHPVGLLILDTSLKNMPAHINDVVTHPGSQRAGGALIERAVRASEQANKGGQLSLYTYDETAEAVYTAWGFTTAANPMAMELDPEKSDKWVMHDNEWHLKSHLDEKLAAASSTHG